MQTTYELALNEFRDASAAVRRAFGSVTAAREAQIIADAQHKTASNELADAQSRLDRADKALAAAREGQGAELASAASIATQTVSASTPRVTQADIDALEPGPLTNGSIDAQAAGIGIG